MFGFVHLVHCGFGWWSGLGPRRGGEKRPVSSAFLTFLIPLTHLNTTLCPLPHNSQCLIPPVGAAHAPAEQCHASTRSSLRQRGLPRPFISHHQSRRCRPRPRRARLARQAPRLISAASPVLQASQSRIARDVARRLAHRRPVTGASSASTRRNASVPRAPRSNGVTSPVLQATQSHIVRARIVPQSAHRRTVTCASSTAKARTSPPFPRPSRAPAGASAVPPAPRRPRWTSTT